MLDKLKEREALILQDLQTALKRIEAADREREQAAQLAQSLNGALQECRHWIATVTADSTTRN